MEDLGLFRDLKLNIDTVERKIAKRFSSLKSKYEAIIKAKDDEISALRRQADMLAAKSYCICQNTEKLDLTGDSEWFGDNKRLSFNVSKRQNPSEQNNADEAHSTKPDSKRQRTAIFVPSTMPIDTSSSPTGASLDFQMCSPVHKLNSSPRQVSPLDDVITLSSSNSNGDDFIGHPTVSLNSKTALRQTSENSSLHQSYSRSKPLNGKENHVTKINLLHEKRPSKLQQTRLSHKTFLRQSQNSQKSSSNKSSSSKQISVLQESPGSPKWDNTLIPQINSRNSSSSDSEEFKKPLQGGKSLSKESTIGPHLLKLASKAGDRYKPTFLPSQQITLSEALDVLNTQFVEGEGHVKNRSNVSHEKAHDPDETMPPDTPLDSSLPIESSSTLDFLSQSVDNDAKSNGKNSTNSLSNPVRDEIKIPTSSSSSSDHVNNNQPRGGHVFNQVERRKDERQKLQAHHCAECYDYYKAGGKSEEEIQEHMRKCGRHRVQHLVPDTPEHYWSLDICHTPLNETPVGRPVGTNRRRRPLDLPHLRKQY